MNIKILFITMNFPNNSTMGRKIFALKYVKIEIQIHDVLKKPTFPPAKEGYKWCTRCKQNCSPDFGK